MWRGRDFLTLQDFTEDEIWEVLRLSKEVKSGNFRERPLDGKNIAMLFQKPSTRTRVSFEVAIQKLGGHALILDWSRLQLSRGETVADTARVLDRYVDGIIARVFEHSILEEMAKHAKAPVINALSDFLHPCQIISDLFTMWEKKGKLKGLNVVFVGDGSSNVCHSLIIGCTKVGANIAVACPREYRPHEKVVQWAKQNCSTSSAEFSIVEDPTEAVENADIVYTDVFVSMGQEAERERRLRTFLPKYQVNEQLMEKCPNALFMHCLPAHRGEEVTDAIIDGPQSIVWDQAENRLHAQVALLALIFGP